MLYFAATCIYRILKKTICGKLFIKANLKALIHFIQTQRLYMSVEASNTLLKLVQLPRHFQIPTRGVLRTLNWQAR